MAGPVVVNIIQRERLLGTSRARTPAPWPPLISYATWSVLSPQIPLSPPFRRDTTYLSTYGNGEKGGYSLRGVVYSRSTPAAETGNKLAQGGLVDALDLGARASKSTRDDAFFTVKEFFYFKYENADYSLQRRAARG